MSEVEVRRLSRADERHLTQWKALCAKADGATIFHEPDFLAYHGDRFDEHHLGYFKGDSLFGVMPMAIVPGEGGTSARSPYGGSYGGPVFASTPDYARADETAAALVGYLKSLGVAQAAVTPPIPVCYRRPSDTFLFALLRHGFRATNSDISSVVPLGSALEQEVFTSRARNMARKAEKLGVTCAFRAQLADFWALMEMTFGKHEAKPTHSHEQWAGLMERLPDSVWVDVAYLDGRPAAGVGHMKINGAVDSSFYLCSDPALRDSQALSFLVARTLLQAQADGFRWFDFGTSSFNMIPRENVFRFKESFGAGGMFRHSYTAVLA